MFNDLQYNQCLDSFITPTSVSIFTVYKNSEILTVSLVWSVGVGDEQNAAHKNTTWLIKTM